MLPNWVRLLVQWLSIAMFFIAILILVQWATLAFIMTGEGYIKWAEGWGRVYCQWTECDAD